MFYELVNVRIAPPYVPSACVSKPMTCLALACFESNVNDYVPNDVMDDVPCLVWPLRASLSSTREPCVYRASVWYVLRRITSGALPGILLCSFLRNVGLSSM